ncbi:MAG: carboxypeptidase-like regulatory domain-containing protein [Flavobacteriaceae bacterium]|nr:carboxypeptidase-like regulatory domain-containing protein [Flavobacteriaceae bacterium]
MKRIAFLMLLIIPAMTVAQTSISGIIKDAKTNKHLPFATLITNFGTGEIADANGQFFIKSQNIITEISVSYIGYKPRKVMINSKSSYYLILLDPKEETLNEVVVMAKENPALQIIDKAIKNKNKNNIDKALRSFQYQSYNKFIVTAEPDSISSSIDSIFIITKGKKNFEGLDSTNYEFKKRIEKSHLYLTEKVSEHQFQRGKNKKETILASRMAGFQEPIYELLALDIDNFSFYEEVYTLLGNKYVNPLANSALKKYHYQILDTVVRPKDSTYMIYYRPKKKSKTIGLEGLLYINSKQYALEKGIAQLKGLVTVKAEQVFEYQNAYEIWFPIMTEISIRKGSNELPVNLFGGISLSRAEQRDSLVRSGKKGPNDVTYLLSKSKNYNVKINQPLKVLNSASSIKFDENAGRRNSAYWNSARTDSITKRDLETYRYIDSLSQKEDIERKLKIARKVLKGYYPTKYFDFDLSQLINFNNYEGFRFGFGGITNTSFSKSFRFNGYTAYGFKDSEFKYHLGTAIRLSKQNNTWLGVSYTDDLKEAAKINFLFDETSFSLINPRNLNISQFYGYRSYNINLEHDIFPNVEAKIKLSKGEFNTKFDYQFLNSGKVLDDYTLSTATLAIKWTPFSKYMNSPIGKITVKKGFPKIIAQVTKSFDHLLDGDVDFTQFNIKVLHTIKLFNTNSTSFLLQGGIVGGSAPLTHLYNATPNYSLRNPWRKRINFSGTDAFETMTFNEFISERYVSLQGRHNFQRFRIGSSFRPRLSLISRFAIGTIDEPENHQGVTFKKMNNGYFESGFVLNHLFRGFGISSFYRYGAYSNEKFSDNLAVKLTYVLSLGF